MTYFTAEIKFQVDTSSYNFIIKYNKNIVLAKYLPISNITAHIVMNICMCTVHNYLKA